MNNLYSLFIKYKHWLAGESLEQAQLVLWLEDNNYFFTSVPNSTYTKSFKQKIMNKLLGLKSGCSDLIIKLHSNSLLFLEMKKPKGKKGGMNGSKISEAQLDWQREINTIPNCQYCITFGYTEAIDLITNLDLGT